jgi:hypothetical protein
MVSRLEALADAIVHYSHWNDPESASYQNRNPGELSAVSVKHPKDATGQRIFKSSMDGYQALIFDLAVKCSGRSRTRLKPDSSLRDLVLAYGKPESTAKFLAKFLKRALGDQSVSEKTLLGYFLEG